MNIRATNRVTSPAVEMDGSIKVPQPNVYRTSISSLAPLSKTQTQFLVAVITVPLSLHGTRGRRATSEEEEI